MGTHVDGYSAYAYSLYDHAWNKDKIEVVYAKDRIIGGDKVFRIKRINGKGTQFERELISETTVCDFSKMKIEDLKNLRKDLVKEQKRFTLPIGERAAEAQKAGLMGVVFLVTGVAYLIFISRQPLNSVPFFSLLGGGVSGMAMMMIGALGIYVAISDLKQPRRYYLLQEEIKKIDQQPNFA